VGQSRRRLCGQALPEAQKATVTANKFAGRSRAKGGGSASRDRRQQECDTPAKFFASITLGRDAVAGPADVSSFLPLLNTDRGRDSEMTSPSFNLGFIDATRILALCQEMHLER